MKVVGLVFPAEAVPLLFCPVCGKGYKSEAALEKHVKDKHPEGIGNASTDPDE